MVDKDWESVRLQGKVRKRRDSGLVGVGHHYERWSVLSSSLTHVHQSNFLQVYPGMYMPGPLACFLV